MLELSDLRETMRGMLDGMRGARASRLAFAIETSPDVRALWHLRAGVMQALAPACGEAEARRRLADLDAMFVEAWPQAPVSRPRLLD